ncbi:MAG: hypothetical protein ACLQIB_27465 [Isosphaeraceae bacterium]
MNRQPAPQLGDIELRLLEILARSDLIVDLDDPSRIREVANTLGTTVEGVGQARQLLGEHGLATSEQITNRRVRAAITDAGREYVQSLHRAVPSARKFAWWNPFTWF